MFFSKYEFILDKFYIHNLRQNMHIFNITSRTVITMYEKKWCESGLTELFIKKKVNYIMSYANWRHLIRLLFLF